MIINETVKEYITRLHGSDSFNDLSEDLQEKLLFSAYELLKDNYAEKIITPRAVAVQSLFMLEGEEEEYAKLKRHGIKSYSIKDVSVTFEGTELSPLVIKMLDRYNKGNAAVGRLI